MTTTNDARPVVLDHVIGDRGRLAVHLRLGRDPPGGDRRRSGHRPDAGRPSPCRTGSSSRRPTTASRSASEEGLGLAFGPAARSSSSRSSSRPRPRSRSTPRAAGSTPVGLRGEQRYRTASGETRLRAARRRIELNTVSGDATIELAGTDRPRDQVGLGRHRRSAAAGSTASGSARPAATSASTARSPAGRTTRSRR